MPVDFLTLEQAKAWLSITDSSNDALLQTAIGATTGAIVNYLNWDPNVQTVTELYNGNTAPELAVNRSKVSAVSAINVIACDGSTWPVDVSTAYVTDFSIGLRNGRFPAGRKNIQVTYTAGLNPIPADIVLAAQMTLKAIWIGKDLDQHTTSEAYDGVVAAGFWPDGPGAIPPQARSYLNSYRLTFKAI